MLINEVCILTGLTKKAVEYYEKQGLLSPETLENGYRRYETKEVSLLKEISLLRKMGICISDIKIIIAKDDKLAALTACKNKLIRKMNMLDMQYKCIDHLIDNGYDIDNSYQYATYKLDDNRIMKDRIAEAFPGNYGMFLSLHFGKFLSEKIDCSEKEIAYGKVIEYLDNLADIPFPKEVEDYFAEVNGLKNEDIMQSFVNDVRIAFDDYDNFMTTKKDMIEVYLEYRKSEEYKNSPGSKMQTLILDFQKSSGYNEIFIENMKILSNDYAEYHKKIQKLNESFLQKYPDAADILGYS